MCKVLVVGAGFAGCSAAAKRIGSQVTIFEKNEYVRIKGLRSYHEYCDVLWIRKDLSG